MRTITSLFFTLLAVSAPAAGDTVFNAANASAVVRVNAHGDDGKTYYGSGVVVGADEVVTNCHVTRHARAITVSKGHLRHRVERQRADVRHDLCLLSTAGMRLPAAVPKGASSLQLGEPVSVYGYPGGIGITFFNGSIEALYPYDGNRVIETTASIGLGTSGGGVFDAAGRLVGIATFVPSRQRGRYYAVATDWLEALRRQPSVAVARLDGLAFWELAEDSQPFFLRTAHLAGIADWASLKRQARRWIAAEEANPEAWYALGLALQKLNQPDSAVRALRKAVSLDDRHAGAWYGLGTLYAARRDRYGLNRVKSALAGLNPTLADRLDTESSRCTKPC